MVSNTYYSCKFSFQLASFSEWIKCTARNAVEKSYQRVERACDTGEIDPPYPPRCDHDLFRPGSFDRRAANGTLINFVASYTPKGC